MKADFETLANALLPFARQQLEKHGEFYPVGAVVTVVGELKQTAYQPSSDHPPSQEVIDGLVDGFRTEAKKKEIRATAIVLDVLVRRPGAATKSDAMEVRLEHVSGVARTVHVPYELSAARRLAEGDSSGRCPARRPSGSSSARTTTGRGARRWKTLRGSRW